MVILPDEPEKLEELLNSVVDKVDFENAPELKLYQGSVAPFVDDQPLRIVEKYDARVEVRKQKQKQRKKVTVEANRNIRETNVIKRTVVDRKGKGLQLGLLYRPGVLSGRSN